MPSPIHSCKPLLKIAIILILTAGIFEPSAIIQDTRGDVVMAQGVIEKNDAGVFRVMTFNIRHGEGLNDEVDLQRIIDVLEHANADIIGLQEVDRYNPRSGFKDQMRVIGDALDMYWVFAPSINLGITQYGNAILSRYPIINSQVTVLPGQHELRTLLQAEIQIVDNLIRVWNTHLGISEGDRKQQIPILMDRLVGAQIPALVLGDFNMEIDHALMNGMKSYLHKAQVGKPTLLSGLEVDHIFYNSAVNAVKAWTIPNIASDHHPVITEFNWNNSNGFRTNAY